MQKGKGNTFGEVSGNEVNFLYKMLRFGNSLKHLLQQPQDSLSILQSDSLVSKILNVISQQHTQQQSFKVELWQFFLFKPPKLDLPSKNTPRSPSLESLFSITDTDLQEKFLKESPSSPPAHFHNKAHVY